MECHSPTLSPFFFLIATRPRGSDGGRPSSARVADNLADGRAYGSAGSAQCTVSEVQARTLHGKPVLRRTGWQDPVLRKG